MVTAFEFGGKHKVSVLPMYHDTHGARLSELETDGSLIDATAGE